MRSEENFVQHFEEIERPRYFEVLLSIWYSRRQATHSFFGEYVFPKIPFTYMYSQLNCAGDSKTVHINFMCQFRERSYCCCICSKCTVTYYDLCIDIIAPVRCIFYTAVFCFSCIQKELVTGEVHQTIIVYPNCVSKGI